MSSVTYLAPCGIMNSDVIGHSIHQTMSVVRVSPRMTLISASLQCALFGDVSQRVFPAHLVVLWMSRDLEACHLENAAYIDVVVVYQRSGKQDLVWLWHFAFDSMGRPRLEVLISDT